MRPHGERTTTCNDGLNSAEAILPPRLVGHWTMRPPTCGLSSRPPISQSRLFTWGHIDERERVLATARQQKTPPERGFVEADEGTRTLDLLHGKQTL